MTLMYDRIKAILKNGVTICDRKYEFLAFSSSQLREHSCWMFSPSKNGITAESIRQWMGDFSDARPVAKFAARVSKIKYLLRHIIELVFILSVRSIILNKC
jgi:RNA-dependent RNA polymerase